MPTGGFKQLGFCPANKQEKKTQDKNKDLIV